MVIRLFSLLTLAILITGCGKTEELKIETGTLTDARDGQKYKTVKIGSTWWMAENLNYATEVGSWCYDEMPENCEKAGRLYDWETAQRVAPEGWRLPSKEDYETLITLAGGTIQAYQELLPGGLTQFNAANGGGRFAERLYRYIEMSAIYWTSTPDDEGLAWCMGLESDVEAANLNNYNRTIGFSVRCVKNGR